MSEHLNPELTAFLSGWLAARGEGELKSFVLAFDTDRATHYVVPDAQQHPASLGLATFAHELALADLRADLNDD